VSLVRDGDWDLGEFNRADRFGILSNREGWLLACYQHGVRGIYSAFPSGMVMFAVPIVSIARVCGADLDRRWVHLRLEKITAALVAALTLSLFFLVACCLGLPAAAGTATFFLAFASAIYTTVGLALWQHGGITFWLLVALLVELRSSGQTSCWGTMVQGVACGALLMCRPTAALIVAAFGTWILLRSPRRAFLTAAFAALAYLPCVVMYWALYGNIFGPATINGNMSGGYWHFGRIETMVGVFICPARGLFVYQPWAILAFLCLFPWVRARVEALGYRAGPRGWIGFCLIVTASHCFLISAWHDWSGGDCWGSRMLTDIVPLLGLLCVPAIATLWASPGSRAVIVALGLVGALTHFPCVYLNAASWNLVANHTTDLWSWSRAPFFYRP
jgi:hypothetical protein